MSVPEVRDVKVIDTGDANVVVEEDPNARRTANW